MKKALTIASLLVAGVVSSHAVTTLQFGSSTGFLTNLQNSSGQANQTLVWGIVVDTDGNGFQPGNYLPGFAISDTATLPGGRFLSTSSGVSGDRLFISTNLMTLGGTGDGSTGLSKPTNINLSYSTEGATGVLAAGNQAFALMWFDLTTKTGQLAADGSKYGLLTLPAFITPADTLGGSVSFASNFTGPDPVRTANLTLGVIPEPSTALLGLLGVLGLVRRRR